MISRSSIPYHNLILTGHIGVGRVAVGQAVAENVGVQFVDLDSELQLRENMAAEEIRQLFGESRLRALEGTLCHELSLRRSTVISVGGQTLLDMDNRDRLAGSGPILVLTCSLNEILRRLHASHGARFHDPRARSAALHQVRRERQILQLGELPTLDTTRLNPDAIAEQAIFFWYERETLLLP